MTRDRATQRLVESARKGDEAAFAELASRFGARIDALIGARLRTPLRERLEPDDIKQEILMRAFRSLSTFMWTDEGSFMRWIAGIAEHVILREQERFRIRKFLPFEGEIAVEDVSPSRRMRREERFERLEAAIARLSPDHREVILLARIERIPGKEIARRMGRTPAAVAQLLARALKKLRKEFGDTASLGLPPRNIETGREGDGEA
ncbi:MAG: sigma-70 family RNA polymerase sigma factor [Planctomycetes bacterium]|nr:sigma-70 family RNA polymerase sigma factor [Planctomycetota bacterium]